MSSVPAIRVRSANSLPVRQQGDFVLYWMISSRRVTWNFALDRAVAWAEKLQKPLVILEALRCSYPWASDRIHRFMLDGMAEHACWLEGTSVYYYPYLEPKPKAGKGLLAALASQASVVVTDDFPCSFLPRMVASAARQVSVLMEVVDSNGLLPMRQAEKAYPTAYAFRRFLQKELPRHLMEFPKANATLERKASERKTSSRRDNETLAEGFSATSEFGRACTGRNSLGSRCSPGGDPRREHGRPSTAEELSAK